MPPLHPKTNRWLRVIANTALICLTLCVTAIVSCNSAVKDRDLPVHKKPKFLGEVIEIPNDHEETLPATAKARLDLLMPAADSLYRIHKYETPSKDVITKAEILIGEFANVYYRHIAPNEQSEDKMHTAKKVFDIYADEIAENTLSTYDIWESIAQRNAFDYLCYLNSISELVSACKDEKSSQLLMKVIKIQTQIYTELRNILPLMTGSEWQTHLTMLDMEDYSAYGGIVAAMTHLNENDLCMINVISGKDVEWQAFCIRPDVAKRFLMDCITTDINENAKEDEYLLVEDLKRKNEALKKLEPALKNLEILLDRWVNARTQWVEKETTDGLRRDFQGNGAQYLVELANAVSPSY